MARQVLEKKEDLRVRRTHKLLIQALISLLEEKPFEEIRVTDICDQAMIHRTTFYKHFEDKYHLLRSGLSELQQELEQKSLEDEPSNHPKQYYMGLLKQVLHYLAINKNLALLVIVKSESNTFTAFLHKLVLEAIICRLENNQKLGVIHHVPLPIIAEFHTGAVISLAKWWLSNDMPVEEEELLKYVDWMINGDNYVFIP